MPYFEVITLVEASVIFWMGWMLETFEKGRSSDFGVAGGFYVTTLGLPVCLLYWVNCSIEIMAVPFVASFEASWRERRAAFKSAIQFSLFM